MPHSSGGGSHSGGSHGGSSHSSSSGSRGSSGSSIRTSHTYFPGAYRYVRYHDGGMDYVYSNDSSLNKSSRSKLSLLLLLFYVPFIIAGIFMATQSVCVPRKMHMSYSPSVQVVDNTHYVSNEEQALVVDSAKSLYETTGVPICVVFDRNAVWETNYNSLENYAYDLYVNRYDDEDHWLIVYTDDGVDRQDVNNFSDWYFEGMQGDNTDPYLPERITSKFNGDLNRALTDKSNSTGEAFAIAFTNMAENAGKPFIDFSMFPMAVVWNGFIAFHMFMMVFWDPHKKYRNYASCGRDTDEIAKSKEVRCSYCGGVYYKGTVTSCPHCGAPLEMDVVQPDTSATGWDTSSSRRKNGFEL